MPRMSRSEVGAEKSAAVRIAHGFVVNIVVEVGADVYSSAASRMCRWGGAEQERNTAPRPLSN